MKKHARIFFVRHGESEWNAEHRLQGHADISLSAKGRGQAAALRPIIPSLGPVKVVASDLRRVKETAELIGARVDAFDPGLRENDVGDWTGRNFDELKKACPQAWDDWRGGRAAPPNGEAWDVFSERVVSSVKQHLSSCDEDLFVVCHGGVIRACISHFLGLKPSQIISVGQASLTAISFQSAGETLAKLELFNFTPNGPSLNSPH